MWGFVRSRIDNGTRFLCLGNNIETADDNWKFQMSAAFLVSGMIVRKRVLRKATSIFERGGMGMLVRQSYRKLTKKEVQSGLLGTVGLRVVKLPKCTYAILNDRLPIFPRN